MGVSLKRVIVVCYVNDLLLFAENEKAIEVLKKNQAFHSFGKI